MATKKTEVRSRGTKNDPVIPLACVDEKAAVEFMEAQCWGDSPCCPRCGSLNIYQMRDNAIGSRQANFRWLCRDCKSAKDTCQFTVRTGTVFEDSKAELRHWCYAFWCAATSNKGVSALEIHRHTGLSYKSSLFMLHRIRFAIAPSAPGPLSGEVDETCAGGKPRYKGESKRGRGMNKPPVLALVEHGGRARTRPVANVTVARLKGFIREQIHASARFIADKNPSFGTISKHADNAAVLEVSWRILNHFIERKSSSFTVKELAEVANISERTFYRYFPRKEDVVRPIFSASTKSLVEYFYGRPHSESIANSLICAFDQSWWANHPEQARTIRYIMYESSELRAVWLQVIIDIEIILSEALAVRLCVAPNSRQALLAATVVTAAIRHAISDFSDADPKGTLTQSFAQNIGIVGPQIFRSCPAERLLKKVVARQNLQK